MRKLVFLVNPISGTAKKDIVLKAVEHTCQKEGLHFEIMPTHANGNYTLLKQKIHEEQITDVVIIGGDGSVNQVVHALHREPIRFGVIPLGSGNGFAYAAAIPANMQKAIDIIIQGHSGRVDAFRVNNQFSCMLTGIGFDAKVAHDFATKARRGLLTYTQQSLINFFKAHPYQFEVVLPEFSFFTDAFFISIANGNQFGNNVTIAPQAVLNDGLLDVVIVQKMNKAKLPFAILRQMRGNNKLQQLVNDIAQKNILYFQVPSIKVRNHRLAPLHIDGEPVETADELNFEIIKDCFELLQPAKSIIVHQ